MAGKNDSNLTDKQKLFVLEYLVDLNASKAAVRAGYSEKTSRVIASELMDKPNVRAAIQFHMDKRAKRTEVDADYVLTTIRSTIERCQQAEPVLDSEGQQTGEYKFDASNVLKGCDLLGKHLKLWNGENEVKVKVNVNALSDQELDAKIKAKISQL